jgi:tryptophan synthase alpha chain
MEAFPQRQGRQALNLQAHIAEQLKERKVLLMTHLIAGFPSLEANWRMLEIMGEVGVDLVELQMPFSEPVADGPTFALANQHALQAGITLNKYFDLMRRSTEAFAFPHLMMGYYNTAFRLGHGPFCQRLVDNGGCGYILPDLPIEEYGDLFTESAERELTSIMLMTPTNTDQRLAKIGAKASGFVYAVARKGVTGSHTDLGDELYQFIARCRQVTDLPIGVGFGLRSGDDLRQLHGQAEIGIVGSELLNTWQRDGEDGYRDLLQDLADGRS